MKPRFPFRVFDFNKRDSQNQPLEYKFQLLKTQEVTLTPATLYDSYSRQPEGEAYPFKCLDKNTPLVRFELTVEDQQFFLTFCATESSSFSLFTPLDFRGVFKKVYSHNKETLKDSFKEDLFIQRLQLTVINVLQYMFEHYATDYIKFGTSKTAAMNNFKLVLKGLDDNEYLTIEDKVNNKTRIFYLCKREAVTSILLRLCLDFERKHEASLASTDARL